MTIDDLNKCAKDEQGRPLVRGSDNDRCEYAVVTSEPDRAGQIVLFRTKDIYESFVGKYCFGAPEYLSPVLPSPHADLVRRLKRVQQMLTDQHSPVGAETVGEAIAALEQVK